MADSVRKTILDAVVTALEGISGIGKISTELKHWEELKPKDFPAAFPIDGDTDLERSAYAHATSEDMEAALEIIVTGYVYDRNNSLTTKRTNHIRAIELALTGDSALAALVLDCVPVKITTDKGMIENYSIFDYTFLVTYQYNHNSP